MENLSAVPIFFQRVHQKMTREADIPIRNYILGKSCKRTIFRKIGVPRAKHLSSCDKG